MGKFQLRKVLWKDGDLLYHWRNEPSTRNAFFHSEEISIVEHKKWLQRKLDDLSSEMYILEVHGLPVGQARLDREGNEAYISYSVSSSFRRRGYGKLLLQMIEQEVRQDSLVLVGKVKKDNIPSRSIFRSLGYEEKERDECFEYRKRAGESSDGNAGSAETFSHCRAFGQP